MSTHCIIHGDALKIAGTLPPHAAALVYLDPPFFTGRRRANRGGGATYDDRWPGGMTEYLAFLRELVAAASRLLSPTGVIALHLDWRASHHGRIELERVFGADGFVNEIIWAYRTGGGSKRTLGRKHDSIHVYAAGKDYTFNPQVEKSYLAHRYGFNNIKLENDERGPYTNVAMRDVWDVPALRGNSLEYSGYPTQKPLGLLKRLVACFTNPGDLVVDLCCGSGTAVVAAAALGRTGLGVDSSKAAVKVARQRLSQVTE